MDAMVVAKLIIGIDDGGFMYDKILHECVCPQCFTPIKKIINPNFQVSSKKGCFRYTYDSYCIVSNDFKMFCEENGYLDLIFVELPKSIGYYYFIPQKIYPLDPVRRKIQFINPCDKCGNFEEIIGLTPAYTEAGFTILSNDFICRSNYEFGSKERKSSAVIIGLETEKNETIWIKKIIL
jgi:hypothetical protein